MCGTVFSLLEPNRERRHFSVKLFGFLFVYLIAPVRVRVCMYVGLNVKGKFLGARMSGHSFHDAPINQQLVRKIYQMCLN